MNKETAPSNVLSVDRARKAARLDASFPLLGSLDTLYAYQTYLYFSVNLMWDDLL